jgi:hypothetical protein
MHFNYCEDRLKQNLDQMKTPLGHHALSWLFFQRTFATILEIRTEKYFLWGPNGDISMLPLDGNLLIYIL